MPLPTITPAPDPPLRTEPATFTTKAEAFVAWMANAPDEFNALAAALSALESGTLSLLLAAIDAAGSGANELAYYTGSNVVALTAFTAAARALLDDGDATTMLSTLGLSANGKSLVTAADYAAMKTLLGLAPGTDIQAYSAKLAAMAAGTTTTQTATTYTAALTDAYGFVRFTNASPVTFTIPPNSSVAFPVDTVIEFSQSGAGALSVAAGAGVTINSRSSDLTLAGQYAVAFVKKVATDTWIMNGDL